MMLIIIIIELFQKVYKDNFYTAYYTVFKILISIVCIKNKEYILYLNILVIYVIFYFKT